MRRAISLAMDRYAYVQGVRHDGAIVGASHDAAPQGTWGLPERELKLLPGYRGSAREQGRGQARCWQRPGYRPGKPLRVELTTRNIAIYVDLASFVADQLRLVGIEATVKQVDTAQYFPALVRRDYQLGANLTASGVDDPDGYLYENYRCGASRNYTDYCNEEMDRLIDQQSQELDRAKRLKLVWEIQRRLEADVARPMLRLAQRVLRQLAVREEPAPAQLALQLRAHAGGVARPMREELRMRTRSLGLGLLLVLLRLGTVSPALAAPPDGTMVIGVHVTLVSRWLDPGETEALITPFMVLYPLHDALVKPMPGNIMHAEPRRVVDACPRTALTYEFVIRKNAKFHNGDPVTAEDVKFTFDRYKGASARLLKDKVKEVQIVAPNRVRFVLKEPWPDFIAFYGTSATGAGWIVPKKYVEKVGEDGYKKAPVGRRARTSSSPSPPASSW